MTEINRLLFLVEINNLGKHMH